MSLLAIIHKRPIILLKKEYALVGYVVSAIYPPGDEDKDNSPAIIFHEECYFRNLVFCSEEVKTCFSRRVMNFYYHETFENDLEIENLCEAEDDSVNDEEHGTVIHQFQMSHIRLEFTGKSGFSHKLAAKMTIWDQVFHNARQLTIKNGDKLKLKSRQSFLDRFSFVGGFQVVLHRKKSAKLLLLVHDAEKDKLMSCNISDIVASTGRGDLKDIDRLVKQLGLSISKQKDMSMIERYDVSSQASMRSGRTSAYSPLVETRKNTGTITDKLYYISLV